MNIHWRPVVLCLLTAAASSLAQPLTRHNLANILGFENGTPGSPPSGWGYFPTDSVFAIDDQVFHGGRYSCRIERTPSTSSTFSSLIVTLPLDFAGKLIQFSGYAKTENVSDSIAFWMREDGATPSLAFSTSQGLQVKGTTDWKPYTITMSVVPTATQFVFGFLIGGTGKAWVDDIQIYVDGIPIGDAPNRIQTVFDTDHEFDAGSKVSLTGLTDLQTSNLATLGKVWGFLKYHHPDVTAGKHHWDYDLFRVLPSVLAAADSATANQAILAWITGMGDIAPCTACATLDSSDLYLGTNLDWLNDATLLGADLSQQLQSIYQNRTRADKTFFVSLAPGIGNPSFDNELVYGALKFPDSGYQLLGLFRFWNMVQYFYPNRDIMADDPAGNPTYWDDVLTASIPAAALAGDAVSYQQELIKFIARIHDTHANLWSSIGVRPPIGTCQLPVDIQFVEGRPLVLRLISKIPDPATQLLPGDVIEMLDGNAVSDLVTQWTPLYADSNDAARMRDIAWYMTRGACGPATVTVQRGDDHVDLTTPRVAMAGLDFSATYMHDRPGDTFQMVADGVAYLKLSSVVAAKSADYVTAAAGTKGLIIDIRNYPSEFVVFSLGSLLVQQATDFVRFTQGDISNPGVFHWMPPITIGPQTPHYSGKIVILVDEVTQSQAEYTTMAFRAVPGAIVIGSTTAGADGNVSTIPLPGNFSSYISGLGVFYPDNRPTQRIGMIPDIEVKPTIAGMRAGRDELVEEAIRQITSQ